MTTTPENAPRPDRLRRVPPRFNWVDHRFIRNGYAQRCTLPALALYLVLVVVGDRHGLSFYSDRSLCRVLKLGIDDLHAARQVLVKLELIAYRAPFYQVLDLSDPGALAPPVRRRPKPTPPCAPPATREQIRAAVDTLHGAC